MELADLNRLAYIDSSARASLTWMRALASAGDRFDAMAQFKTWMGVSGAAQVGRYEKAAVAAMTTATDPALAFAPLHVDLLRLLAPFTLIGRLVDLGARRLPLNTLTPIVSDGAVTASFVGERQPIPALILTSTPLTFMQWLKVGVVLGVSREWAASTDDRVTGLLGQLLQRPIGLGLDLALLGDTARVDGTSPAGLLNGIVSSGAGSPGSLDDDLPSLWANVRAGSPERPVFIASPSAALYLYGLRLEGVPVFPDAGPRGGSIAGVPLITSPAASNRLILIDAACLGVFDGGLSFDVSQSATIQLNTAPADSAGQVLSSGFQQNLAFVKVLRFVDWTLAYSDAIGYVDLPIAA
jgi:HK97 family phage major capsid protein